MWRCYGSLEVSLSSEGGWNLRKKMWLVKAKLQKELGANLMRKKHLEKSREFRAEVICILRNAN